MPEGLVAREALAPRHGEIEILLFWFIPNLRREEGLVQERRQLSGCWVTAILHTFSLLGRTKSLTCDLWRSGHRPHPRLRGPQLGPLGQTAANTTSCPPACKQCYRYP